MIRGFYLTALVALLASFATSAEAQVSLKHKFPDGRKTRSHALIKTSQTLTLNGNDLVSGADQSVTVVTTNGQRAADGTLVVNNKIEALKADVTLPGGTELAFDSANPDADPPGTAFDVLLDVFKASVKSSWESVMNKDNRVVAIKGRDEAFADLPENIRDAMKPQLDPEYLATVANDELDKLPSEPVSPGDSWERTNTVRLDSGQKIKFTVKYTYAGRVEQDGKALDKIESTTTGVEYSADPNPLFKLVESDLKVAESAGVILFDPEFGQIVSQRNKVQIKGSLTLNALDMELAGQLDLTIENSVAMKEVPSPR